MKFLLLYHPRFPVPPEMTVPALTAFLDYLAKYKESGHIKASYSFAGVVGGMALIQANSHEELDKMLAENPLGPTSDITVYPQVNLEESVQHGLEVAKARMEAFAKMQE